MKPIPRLSADLIEELDTAYPARPPRLTDSDRQIWFDAGQRALVDHLKLRQAKHDASSKVIQKER